MIIVEVAVSMYDSVAKFSDPVPSKAEDRVRVVAVQMSATKVPKVERVRVVTFQTLVGIEVAKDDEAASIVVLVFALTTAAIDEEAVVTTFEVFVFTTAAIDEEAVVIVVVKVEVAVLMYDSVAKLPPPPSKAEDRARPTPTAYDQTSAARVVTKCLPTLPAAVSVEVATFQTSKAILEMAASRVVTKCLPTLPAVVKVEVATFQIDEGSDDDAVVTTFVVFAFTTSAIDEEAELFQTLLEISVVEALT